MNKDKVFQLKAITRQLTCMNPVIFNKTIDGDTFEMTFDHFCFDEDAKIQTKIIIKKIEVPTEKQAEK